MSLPVDENHETFLAWLFEKIVSITRGVSLPVDEKDNVLLPVRETLFPSRAA